MIGALLGAMAGKVAPAAAPVRDAVGEASEVVRVEERVGSSPAPRPGSSPAPRAPEQVGTDGQAAVGTPPAALAPAPLSPTALGVASVATAALFAAAAEHFGSAPELVAYCVLFAALVALSLVDLRVGLVPRTMLYPLGAAMVVALAAASASQGEWRALGDAAIGGVAAFAVFFAVWWVHPRGMGLGDVRLAALIGAGLGWLGLLHVYVGFVVGFLAGALFGIVVMAARGTGRKTKLPFAPALAIGAVVGVLWGSALVNAWLPGHG